MEDYSITFATLNCIDYTQKCIQSLVDSGTKPTKIVAVDNGSTDGTQEYLKNVGLGGVILNKQNLSCGAAWNQGILAAQSEWTIVMNNDIVVPKDFAARLIQFAIDNNLKLVSPARIDGEMNYDYPRFYGDSQIKMADAVRMGTSNLVCLCIHWSVFNNIGFFRANPKLLGFEDGIFYNDVRKGAIGHATTGSVWIHHFGSVTQEHMKLALGISEEKVLVKVNDRKMYNQSWLDRKIYRYKLKKSYREWRRDELSKYGMTVHGVRKNNEFIWI